jgi:hypothetical protein
MSRQVLSLGALPFRAILWGLVTVLLGCTSQGAAGVRLVSEADATRIAVERIQSAAAGAKVEKTSAELIRRGEQHPILRDPRSSSFRDSLTSRDVWLIRVALLDASRGTKWTEMVFIDRATGEILFR